MLSWWCARVGRKAAQASGGCTLEEPILGGRATAGAAERLVEPCERVQRLAEAGHVQMGAGETSWRRESSSAHINEVPKAAKMRETSLFNFA